MSGNRRALAALAIVGCLLPVLTLVVALTAKQTIPQAIPLASGMASLIPAAALMVQVVRWARRRRAAAPPTRAQLRRALDAMAAMSTEQVKDEGTRRGLVGRELMDVPWRLRGRCAEGVASDVKPLAESFRQTGRLVITGGPGSGKSALALILARHLLEDRAPGDPVPVPLPLSGWDPAEQTFDAWLAARLLAAYPALAAADYGSGAASALVAHGMIVPMLDGVDELPQPLRVKVIRALGTGVVLTCRPREYKPELVPAEVVELLPLPPAAVTDYLGSGLPGRPAGLWRCAMQQVRQGGHLAEALDNPLYLWLARILYVDGRRRPKALLRATTVAAVREHLLDALLPAALTSRWPIGRARAWLATLADHQSGEYVWWRLHTAFSPWVLRVLTGVLAAAGCAGIAAAFPLPVGVDVLLVAGFLAGLAAHPRGRPLTANLVLRGRVGSLLSHLGKGICTAGVAVALATFAAAWVVAAGSAPIIPTAAGRAVMVGLVAGVTRGIIAWVAEPSGRQEAGTPHALLVSERRLTLLAVLAPVLVALVLLAVQEALVKGLNHAAPYLPDAVTLTLISALGHAPHIWISLGVLVSVACTAPRHWLWYVLSRSLLALRGRLPWRLPAFLAEMRGAGVLRQAGEVYQFRHDDLRRRLSSAAPDPARPAAAHRAPPSPG